MKLLALAAEDRNPDDRMGIQRRKIVYGQDMT